MTPSLPKQLSLLAEIKSMPRPVFVLVAGMFVNRLGAFVYPFLALFLKDKGFTFTEISGVIASMAVGNFFGPVAGGYLADAIGRRNALVVSLFSTAILVFGLYVSEHYIGLLSFALLYGFAVSSFHAPANALLSDLVEEESRATAFALFRLAINTGFAIGPSLAGLLYTFDPFWIFAGDALTTAVFGVVSWRYLPHGLRTVEGKVSSISTVARSWIEALSHAFQNGPFRRYIFASFLMGAAFTQLFSLLSISSTDRGLSTQGFGLIMGLNGLLIVLIELPLTHKIRKAAPSVVLAIGYVLIGLGCAGFAWSESIWGFALAMTIFTLGEIAALPVGMSYSASLAPQSLRGRYFGIRGVTWAMSSLVSSLGVWCYGQLGHGWWAIVGSLSVIAGIIMATQKLKSVSGEAGAGS